MGVGGLTPSFVLAFTALKPKDVVAAARSIPHLPYLSHVDVDVDMRVGYKT
jgi:hypothetical protein